MDTQTLIYIFVGLSFALYIGIAIWSRAGSTKEFYVTGGRFSLRFTRRVAWPSRFKHADSDARPWLNPICV